MNRPLRALIGLAAGAALLSTATYAAAQEHPAQAPGAMAEKWKEHRHERADAHARALHDILNIRPDQDAAFQAFLASMKPPEHGDHKGHEDGRAEFAHLTTPQRLDRKAAMMTEHQARFQQHVAAVKTFYAILSPEQQRAFDALNAMHGRGGGRGFGGGGHMGPGPQAMEGPEGPEGFQGSDMGSPEQGG
ncbi:MAG TPA: Spy/CpxP family protein refolding chaperone [Caulobacteraceae bacterium]|jgi:Spy/CpxP family protein refolding chaperone